MTIRNFKYLAANTWDWAVFDGCFGGAKMSMSDIDGVVERGGNFLFVETKSPGAPIPMGQSILFSQLAKLPHTYVLMVWGKPGKAEQVQVWPDGDKHDCTTEDVRKMVAKWYKWANSHRRERV